MSGSKSNTSSNQNVQQQVNLPPWLDSAWQSAINDATAFSQQTPQNYTGMFSAPINQTWQGGIDATKNLVNAGPSAAYTSGMNGLSANLGFTGSRVNAPTYSAVTGQAAQGNAATIDPNSVGAVSAGNVKNVSDYMNPYTNSVVDATLGDIANQRDMAVANQGAKLGNNLWGSRGAILLGQTADPYARQMATTAANLRSQGYTNAQQAASSDADRALQAGLANQNSAFNIANANMGARNAMTGLNVGAQNAMTAANLGFQNSANQNNAAMNLQGQLANQSADQTAAQLRQAAAGGLISADQSQQGLAAQFAKQLSDQGLDIQNLQNQDLAAKYQEFLRQQQIPYDQFNLRLSSLGLAPYNKNTTTNATGNSSTTSLGIKLLG